MAAAASLGLLYTAFAYFEDTEASAGNSFRVGTWAVGVGGGGNTAAYTFQDLEALGSGTQTWTVQNTGSVSAFVDMNINVTESGTGNLGGFLTAHLYVSGGADIYSGAISGMGGGYDLNLPLGAGESRDIVLDWNVEGGYAPDINDQVGLTISFDIQPAP
jgi:hypothetical protein